MIEVYPALDVLDGRAVRLLGGDFRKVTDYGDPQEVARRYLEAGATRIHVVDLDAARDGKTSPKMIALVRELCSWDWKVQVGGGVRDLRALQGWLELGVWRCVMGTAALDAQIAAEAHMHCPGQVLPALDARNGYVAVRGWVEQTRVPTVELAMTLGGLGYEEIMWTDIGRDGGMVGADAAGAVDLARATGLRVIASGGVRSLMDVATLATKGEDGVSGVIIGRALLSGAIDLRAVLALARESLAS
jgi:phosphoribosylformimino-5-aminoimidazole carboxamide ribotide isomerase